jgi:3-dehydroquinate dehydratase
MLRRTLTLARGPHARSLIRLAAALRARKEPLIDVHLSNIYPREETFRQHFGVLLAGGMIRGFDRRGSVMAPDAPAALASHAC